MAKFRISKSQKKAQRRLEEQREKALLDFLRDYGEPESPQSAEAAIFDNQIKSIATLLASQLVKSAQGTIFDLGCGNGIILSRLAELSSFMEKTSWNYVGVDYPEYRENVFEIAIGRGLHRRVDFFELSNFQNEWPRSQELRRPYIVLIRNVIHELSIEDTATLLGHVARNLKAGELFVVQDLQVFPKAEKGNACWSVDALRNVIRFCGFETVETVEPSRTGNRWVNIIGTRNETNGPQQDEIKKAVLEARRDQWAYWRELGALHPDDEKFRDVRIAKIDFDLQFAALNNQLLLAGASGVDPLSRDQQATIVKDTFRRALDAFLLSKPNDIREVIEDVPHFVDRGNSQDSLETYLASEYAITAILGPTLMGKTALIRHVLSNFHHDRVPVLVDIQATASVWNIIESILSSIRCQVSSEVLASLQKITFGDIREIISTFFESVARNTVIALDHFERLLNPLGQLSDSDIQDLIGILARSREAKVIITSRRAPNLSFLPTGLIFPEPQPPVGRFPEMPRHVEQLLGKFIGLKSFPAGLIEAIDRHPLLAVLAGIFLRKAGKEAIEDEQVLTEMRHNMRDAIFSRIVDDQSRPAIIAISRLRIPAPRSMIVALSSETSVKSAEEVGLVFHQRDLSRTDLLSCIGALRLRTWQAAEAEIDDDSEPVEENQEASPDSAEKDTHNNIAALYHQLYRHDDDPKWLREICYHRMLVGDIEALNRFGVSFRSEISGAGEYWFRYRRDFNSALWAFQTAQRYGDRSLFVRMRVASCLMRTKRQEDGEEQFKALIQEFPDAPGVKSSYIDGVLFIRDYNRALELLNEFSLTIKDGAWVAGQFGRAYMGLQLHEEAIKAFNQQLLLEEEPLTYQNLARAYHQRGATENERRVLERGLRVFPHSSRLQLSYASVLERIGQVSEASERLMKLLHNNPGNGWVMFPLIKALGRLGEIETALQVWNAGKDKLRPELLRYPIEAALAVEQGHYDDALSLMRLTTQDEHSVGQRVEIYYVWAENTNNEDGKMEIARRGLEEFSALLESNLGRNVPLLISYAKLSIVARDIALYEEIERRIRQINPDITELERIKAEMTSDGPDEL
jgi:tetratricopeptide (TPR) repeat protein